MSTECYGLIINNYDISLRSRRARLELQSLKIVVTVAGTGRRQSQKVTNKRAPI